MGASITAHFCYCFPMAGRNWLWTLNNYWAYGLPDPLEWPHHRYTVYQEEIGTDHTPHLQGYTEFTKVITLAALKTLMPQAHFEPRKGTKAQARAYCQKEDTRISDPLEFGELPKQGQRTDLDTVCQAVIDGCSRQDIAREFPSSFVRYHRGLDELRQAVLPKVTPPPYPLSAFSHDPLAVFEKPQLIFGDSSTGKTAFALAHFTNPLLVRHLDDLKSHVPRVHDGIVFDDMAFLHIPVESRIHLLDWDYDSSIHCRYANATIPARTPRVFTHNTGHVFTMQHDPRHEVSAEHLVAITRRLEITGPIHMRLFSETF